MNYTPAGARRLLSLITSPEKETHFSKGGHDLPASWVDRAADWMNSYLK